MKHIERSARIAAQHLALGNVESAKRQAQSLVRSAANSAQRKRIIHALSTVGFVFS